MTRIFDTHAHYADKQFDKDRSELLGKILPASGIAFVMLAGTTLDDCRKNQLLSEQYEYLFHSVGIHPEYVQNLPSGWLSELETLALNPKCKAIGEIGLDYFRQKTNSNLQKEILLEQLHLAEKLNLPCVFHFRKATSDAVQILIKYQPKGIFHSYSLSPEITKILLRIPELYFSFSGVITYSNAKKALSSLAMIPENRILFETDSPFLPPVSGTRNDSRTIFQIAEKAAQIKQLPTQELMAICYENACKIFSI